jgi:hypothetical protein
MKVITGGMPDYISDCLADIRELVRSQETIDNTKTVQMTDLLEIIARYDAEEYFIDREVRISPNTTIRLRRNYE